MAKEASALVLDQIERLVQHVQLLEDRLQSPGVSPYERKVLDAAKRRAVVQLGALVGVPPDAEMKQ